MNSVWHVVHEMGQRSLMKGLPQTLVQIFRFEYLKKTIEMLWRWLWWWWWWRENNRNEEEEEEEGKMGIKLLRKENNKIVKRRGVSKTLFAV